MARFSLAAVRELPGATRYTSEILAQTRALVVGTTGMVIFLEIVFGAVAGVFSQYALRSLGGVDYIGAVTGLAALRGAGTVMVGYVLAAKVGCGLVAEIGSMRISDELDAFESVGLHPMRFVVATRLAAMWLFLPFIFCLAMASIQFGSYLAVVVNIGEVSYGTWSSVHFSVINLQDYLFAFVSVFAIGTGVVLVGMYYGYRAYGGPAEVGQATAQSMVVNLVLVHAVLALGVLIFYGANPRLPLGG